MAPHKQKGGNFLSALEIGTAFFAAKNSRSFPEFLATFSKYFLFLIVFVIVIGLVYRLILSLFHRDYFNVPEKPSPEGDTRMVTPAGNVILY
jgi:hypothetical protein